MPSISAPNPSSLTPLNLKPQSSDPQPSAPPRQNSDDRIESIGADPHIIAGNIAHWFTTLNEIMLPVTIAADILRLKNAFAQDDGHIKEHTLHAATGIAAGLAGAYAGGNAGAQAGMFLGSEIGAAAGPGGAIIGAAVGGVSGSLIGSIGAGLGAAKLGEALADHATSTR